MNISAMIITVLGLCLFEIVSSIDNAVINAEVLSTMSKKSRDWFLFWGLLIAVFLIRGLLPWLIVWLSIPEISLMQAFTATWSSDPMVHKAIESSAPILLLGGGVFLIFLFLHWLFLEPKTFGLRGEKFFQKHGVWFYATVSMVLSIVVWYAIKLGGVLAFGAVIGSTAFFITSGFKENAERAEKSLALSNNGMGDLSKILYLEIIDSTFSIDGVLGAFAFTLSVPLILIGNGLGAFILRKLTVSNTEKIKKYIYLKNGAMYSIFALGLIMTLDAFGLHIPQITSPVVTFIIIGYFFLKSKQA